MGETPTATHTATEFTSVSSSASTCMSPSSVQNVNDSLNPNTPTNTMLHITVTPIKDDDIGTLDAMNNMMRQYNLNKNMGLTSPMSTTMTPTLQTVDDTMTASPSMDSMTFDTLDATAKRLEFQNIDCGDVETPMSTQTVVHK